MIAVLVGKGVGRKAAVRLVRERPDECRKYLEWLPFAEVKSTEAAWLVNAIQDGYGPPKAITKRQAEASQKAKASESTDVGGPQSPQGGRGAELQSRLRLTHALLTKTRPEAATAFEAYYLAVREKAARMAETLTERGRTEFLSVAQSEDYRLSLFERWLRGEGRQHRNMRRVEHSEMPGDEADSTPQGDACRAPLGP